MKNPPFFHPNVRQDNPRDSKPFVKDILIPFGSLLIAAIMLLTVNYKLPMWAIIFVIVYLIFVMGVVVVTSLYRLWSFLHKKQREKKFAKKFYPQLQDSSMKFTQLIETRRSDTIFYLVQDIKAWDELRDQPILFDAEHITTIRG